MCVKKSRRQCPYPQGVLRLQDGGMYTVLMRFEVPQFIEVEDKIVGPFTWKQFVYLAGGAGAGIMLFILLPFYLFILTAGPVAALAAGLAFYPVNNRPFSVFLESVVRYAASARLYLWRKQEAREKFCNMWYSFCHSALSSIG